MQTNTCVINAQEHPEDRIIWASKDKQILVRQRVSPAGRWPQHECPVITLDVLPKPGTRVRQLGQRVDILLEHEAASALISALNAAEGSV